MSSNENMLKGRVTIGDWSGDGHSVTEIIDILIPEGLTAKSEGWDQGAYIQGRNRKTWGCSNTPDLWFYYHLALSKGVPDLKDMVCSEYEEYTTPKGLYDEILSSIGQDPSDERWQVDEEDEGDVVMVYIDPEIYSELWVAIVNYGIKLNGETGEVKTYRAAKEKVLNYNIGGYGLVGNG